MTFKIIWQYSPADTFIHRPCVLQTQKGLSWLVESKPQPCVLERETIITYPQCPPNLCQHRWSVCSLWTSSKCLYMCVCASDSGTADFREGLLADGQSPDTNQHTQSSARARAHHIHSNTAQLCYVGVCVGAWVFLRVCTAADGVELLTCGYGR